MKMIKNDQPFICEWCGREVKPLGYTSRDHCPYCLVSKHVDIVPGDRENDCQGMLIPIGVELNTKKGTVIKYKCTRCKQLHNNKASDDDRQSTLLSIMNGSYNENLLKKG